jgi:hypothetical protein
MAVLHDYKCDLHGFFEAWEPVCPDGCTENVQMVFLQPVGMKSDTTKHNDKTINQLALDFNMTNIKSAREGENQSGFYTRNNKPATQRRTTTAPRIPSWRCCDVGKCWRQVEYGYFAKRKCFQISCRRKRRCVTIYPGELDNTQDRELYARS